MGREGYSWNRNCLCSLDLVFQSTSSPDDVLWIQAWTDPPYEDCRIYAKGFEAKKEGWVEVMIYCSPPCQLDLKVPVKRE